LGRGGERSWWLGRRWWRQRGRWWRVGMHCLEQAGPPAGAPTCWRAWRVRHAAGVGRWGSHQSSGSNAPCCCHPCCPPCCCCCQMPSHPHCQAQSRCRRWQPLQTLAAPGRAAHWVVRSPKARPQRGSPDCPCSTT